MHSVYVYTRMLFANKYKKSLKNKLSVNSKGPIKPFIKMWTL